MSKRNEFINTVQSVIGAYAGWFPREDKYIQLQREVSQTIESSSIVFDDEVVQADPVEDEAMQAIDDIADGRKTPTRNRLISDLHMAADACVGDEREREFLHLRVSTLFNLLRIGTFADEVDKSVAPSWTVSKREYEWALLLLDLISVFKRQDAVHKTQREVDEIAQNISGRMHKAETDAQVICAMYRGDENVRKRRQKGLVY